jgi:hypothetical protein
MSKKQAKQTTKLHFSMSEGQAATFPDWESRELDIEVTGRVFLVFGWLQDEDEKVIAKISQELWMAIDQSGQLIEFSDVSIEGGVTDYV